MLRHDNRSPQQLRPIKITPRYNRYAEGSALIEFGHTQVVCNASVESYLPKWLQGQDQGWISAEYGMLPRSTHERMNREKTSQSGRSQEISRLIGRSLRSCVDLYKLKDISITLDCDVIQADGGTRTAAITGAFVSLALAVDYLMQKKQLSTNPIKSAVSAVSVGLLEGEALLDLCYQEDSNAETDSNFVINSQKNLVEIQATAEEHSFTQTQFLQMLDLAYKGCAELHGLQKEILKQQNVSFVGEI